MPALANVALSNTFDQFRVRTNEIIQDLNNLTNNTGVSNVQVNTLTANTLNLNTAQSNAQFNVLSANTLNLASTLTLNALIANTFTVLDNSYLPDIAPSLNLNFVNGKRLDNRITFNRNSTATFYDGTTNFLAEENLLTYSNNIPSFWGTTNLSVANTTATTAPDGTNTAVILTDNANSGAHFVYNSISPYNNDSVTQTLSCYAKAGTGRYFSLQISDGGNRAYGATFDLQTGVVTSTGVRTFSTVTSTSITAVGNNWYRCTVTGKVTNSPPNSFRLAMSDTPTPTYGLGLEISYVGTGNTIYVWGPQFEEKSFAGPYIPTQSNVPIRNYMPKLMTSSANTARFDHNPVTGESLGLLLEDSRTNLITLSGNMAAWTQNNSVATANAIFAPDGTLSGTKSVMNNTSTNTADGGGSILGFSATSGVTYTISFYAKKETAPFVKWHIWRAAYDAHGSFEFDTQTALYGNHPNLSVTSFSSTFVGNGWYRLRFTFTPDSTALGGSTGNISLLIGSSLESGSAGTYDRPTSGDGVSGVYIWGAQVEVGTFASSYIPTTSTTATRSADTCQIVESNFTSWFNPNEGTLYFEGVARDSDAVNYENLVTITDDLNNSPRSIGFDASSTGGILYFRGGSAITFSSLSSTPTFMKLAGAYKNFDYAAVRDGSLIVTSTTGLVPAGMTRMKIGVSPDTPQQGPFNGTIRRIIYYAKRLTNTQLLTMTK